LKASPQREKAGDQDLAVAEKVSEEDVKVASLATLRHASKTSTRTWKSTGLKAATPP
jgi:hypothetical protein